MFKFFSRKDSSNDLNIVDIESDLDLLQSDDFTIGIKFSKDDEASKLITKWLTENNINGIGFEEILFELNVQSKMGIKFKKTADSTLEYLYANPNFIGCIEFLMYKDNSEEVVCLIHLYKGSISVTERRVSKKDNKIIHYSEEKSEYSVCKDPNGKIILNKKFDINEVKNIDSTKYVCIKKVDNSVVELQVLGYNSSNDRCVDFSISLTFLNSDCKTSNKVEQNLMKFALENFRSSLMNCYVEMIKRNFVSEQDLSSIKIFRNCNCCFEKLIYTRDSVSKQKKYQIMDNRSSVIECSIENTLEHKIIEVKSNNKIIIIKIKGNKKNVSQIQLDLLKCLVDMIQEKTIDKTNVINNIKNIVNRISSNDDIKFELNYYVDGILDINYNSVDSGEDIVVNIKDGGRTLNLAKKYRYKGNVK